jgi:hypothetical protein
MELAHHLHLRRRGGLERARPAERPPRRNPAAPSEPPTSELERAQRTPAPEDRALYACGCGFAFTAGVTTSVACPHCGAAQAW